MAPLVQTTLESGPSGTDPKPSGTVTFSSPAPLTICSLDGTAYLPCGSPYTYGPLPNGDHNLRIRSTDSVGNIIDEAEASVSWTIADTDPPETTITNHPRPVVKKKRPVIDYTADEVGSKFQCSYDGEAFRRCRPPQRGKVSIGRHTFAVRAVDVGGNVDPTPATTEFKRARKCRKAQRRAGNC